MLSGAIRRAGRHALRAAVLVSIALDAQAGSLGGEVRVGIDGVPLAEAGAVVVFLEAEAGAASAPGAGAPAVAIRQNGARFEPDFVAVAVGQRVEMPNDDVIYHNVFSYSQPNDFDLGLYAAGESHAVRFEHAGLVRIYCSIHDEMDGLIFVAPTRLHAMLDEHGRYSIEGVPGGRYRLHVWSERLPEWVQTVEVPASQPLDLDLEIGRPPAMAPAAPAAPAVSAPEEG